MGQMPYVGATLLLSGRVLAGTNYFELKEIQLINTAIQDFSAASYNHICANHAYIYQTLYFPPQSCLYLSFFTALRCCLKSTLHEL